MVSRRNYVVIRYVKTIYESIRNLIMSQTERTPNHPCHLLMRINRRSLILLVIIKVS
jgi:hypothetical protein